MNKIVWVRKKKCVIFVIFIKVFKN